MNKHEKGTFDEGDVAAWNAQHCREIVGWANGGLPVDGAEVVCGGSLPCPIPSHQLRTALSKAQKEIRRLQAQAGRDQRAIEGTYTVQRDLHADNARLTRELAEERAKGKAAQCAACLHPTPHKRLHPHIKANNGSHCADYDCVLGVHPTLCEWANCGCPTAPPAKAQDGEHCALCGWSCEDARALLPCPAALKPTDVPHRWVTTKGATHAE